MDIEEKLYAIHKELCSYFSTNPSLNQAKAFLEEIISKYFNLENEKLKKILHVFWWIYITPNYTVRIAINGIPHNNYLEFNKERVEEEFKEYKDEITKRIIFSKS